MSRIRTDGPPFLAIFNLILLPDRSAAGLKPAHFYRKSATVKTDTVEFRARTKCDNYKMKTSFIVNK